MFKLIPFLIIIILLIPFSVQADFNPINALKGPIVPCGIGCLKWEGDRCVQAKEGMTLERAQSCTLCHFFVMAKNIIEFILALIMFLVPVFVAAGGIIILTSSGKPDQVGWGKKMITYALIGLVIAFGAWTIIGTVLNTLIGGENIPVIPWAWYEFRCSVP